MNETFIHDYVKSTCDNPNNILSKYFFKEHICSVVEFSEKLSDILNGDKEIVRAAAYLHDISAVMDFRTLPTHNSSSAEIARDLLSQKDYPGDAIDRIYQCIIKHVSPIALGAGTIEEVCLSNADAISQIVNPGYWFYFAFEIRKLAYDEGKDWYLKRIEDNWNKLIDPAKKLIESNYLKVKECFGYN